MNSIKSNIRKFLLGLIILCSGIPLWAASQNDSIVDAFKTRFSKNIRDLNELYFFSDVNSHPGNFHLDADADFEKFFRKMDLPFFSQLLQNAAEYYDCLDSLPLQQKQNFVRYFSFYDKEFESQFIYADLPLELKYLAPTLSAMHAFGNEPIRNWRGQ